MKNFNLLFIISLLLYNSCSTKNRNIKNIAISHSAHRKEVFSYYIDSKGKKIKHGLYSHFSLAREGNICSERHVSYKDGEKHGIEVIKGTLGTTLGFYHHGKPIKAVFFNKKGDKIAECTMKNDKHYTGTVWWLAFGLQGVKYNQIATFKNGKLIKVEECCNLLGETASKENKTSDEKTSAVNKAISPKNLSGDKNK